MPPEYIQIIVSALESHIEGGCQGKCLEAAREVASALTKRGYMICHEEDMESVL